MKTNKVYTSSQRRKLWGRVQNVVGEYSRFRARELVYHLYKKGYSYADVGNVLGTSRQYVEKSWPKGEHDRPNV